MQSKWTIMLLISLVVCMFPSYGQAMVDISAQHAILMEASTGRVLYEKDAHDKKPIASITKIMTAILALESQKLEEQAFVSKRAVYTGGSSIYLQEGEVMNLEDLVYGLMLRSGNDASVAIAEHLAGSVEGFVYLMNEQASWLGMTNTSFKNPHGLNEDGHYSTAYDMALLMRYALESESFKQVSQTKMYQAENNPYSWKNKNKLLTEFYPYCTGGKTGYTKHSGRTLVTTAEKDGLELIAVTLNAPDDWNDHMKMFEWGFENYKLRTILKEGKKSFISKEANETVIGYIAEDYIYPLTEEEVSNLSKTTYLLLQRNDGEIIGKTVLNTNVETIAEVAIYSKKQVNPFSVDVLQIIKKLVGMTSDG